MTALDHACCCHSSVLHMTKILISEFKCSKTSLQGATTTFLQPVISLEGWYRIRLARAPETGPRFARMNL